MEQSSISSTPAGEGIKDGSAKILILTALVIALCGIGLGVFGLLQSAQKDGQISDLKAQIQSSQKPNVVTGANETPEPSSTSINVENAEAPQSVADEYDSKDYVIIGEFGLKLKKPENWRNLVRKYVFHNDYPHAVDTFEIVENEDVATSHVMISPGSGNCKDDEWLNCVEVKLSEQITVDVMVPKASSDSITEEFRNWVTNPDNYSKI